MDFRRPGDEARKAAVEVRSGTGAAAGATGESGEAAGLSETKNRSPSAPVLFANGHSGRYLPIRRYVSALTDSRGLIWPISGRNQAHMSK
ncbi:hypothetical protein ACFPES_17575 [Paenibacillus sp. GCM10023248]|nr:hypothetical protein [Paenibacillus sp. MAHUQ-63]